jgi:hypothetical protein
MIDFAQISGERQEEWDAPAGAGAHQEASHHAACRGTVQSHRQHTRFVSGPKIAQGNFWRAQTVEGDIIHDSKAILNVFRSSMPTR